MKAILFTKSDFTLGELIGETEDLLDDVLVLNSCYTEAYNIEKIDTEKFDQIRGIYNDTYSVVDYVFGGQTEDSLRLKDLRKFAQENPELLTKPIERDVEDGYVYSAYDSFVYNDKRLILC